MTTGCKTNTVDNLNNVTREASRHFRNKKNIWKLETLNVKLRVRPRIPETCIGAPMILKGYQPSKGLEVFWLGGGTTSLSYMRLILYKRNTNRRATSACNECLWIWGGYWKAGAEFESWIVVFPIMVKYQVLCQVLWDWIFHNQNWQVSWMYECKVNINL